MTKDIGGCSDSRAAPVATRFKRRTVRPPSGSAIGRPCPWVQAPTANVCDLFEVKA